MKRNLIGLLGLFFLLTSCQKDVEISLKQSVSEKIAGKWLLVNYVEECYQPANQLISKEETPGLPGDSLVFKNNIVHSYSDIDGNFTDPYELLDDKTLRIEYEEWTIAKLTDTEFHLFSDETETATNERTVVRIFLRRQ